MSPDGGQRGPVTLLVASGGGHLRQLATLVPRFGLDRSIVVTYSAVEAEGQFDPIPDGIVEAFHPTTKNVKNALSNYKLARSLFRTHDIARVVSTGAAVAVPLIYRARQLGLPCHYIESATRVTGPSLSAQLIQNLSGIHLYRQHGDWGGPHWQQGPNVFDGFSAVQVERTPPGSVLVSMGTHHFPFDALRDHLLQMDALMDGSVIWQLGSTHPRDGMPGEVCSLMGPSELQDAVVGADVAIGHAGVGFALMCLEAGKVPILIPRRRQRREHTDDHQVELAHALARRGLAVTAEVEELSSEHLERALHLSATHVAPSPFTLQD